MCELPDIGIPRDGRPADLLAEAASPEPRFAAVICEDIERSGRDTYYALQLEKQLTPAGIPLFATDEPIDVADANATTVLVRRVKQGRPSGSGCRSRRRPAGGCVSIRWPGGTSAPLRTDTSPNACRTRCRSRPPRAGARPVSSWTRSAPRRSRRSSNGAPRASSAATPSPSASPPTPAATPVGQGRALDRSRRVRHERKAAGARRANHDGEGVTLTGQPTDSFALALRGRPGLRSHLRANASMATRSHSLPVRSS